MKMNGPSADKLLSIVEPMIQARPFLKNVTITLVYGPRNRKVIHLGSRGS